jgi:hypothetical protein
MQEKVIKYLKLIGRNNKTIEVDLNELKEQREHLRQVTEMRFFRDHPEDAAIIQRQIDLMDKIIKHLETEV